MPSVGFVDAGGGGGGRGEAREFTIINTRCVRLPKCSKHIFHFVSFSIEDDRRMGALARIADDDDDDDKEGAEKKMKHNGKITVNYY